MYSITRSGPLPFFHHNHHSFELEQVDAQVVEIVDTIDHEIYFRYSPSLYHWTVKELEAILVKVQADLAVQEVQEVPEVHKAQEMDS